MRTSISVILLSIAVLPAVTSASSRVSLQCDNYHLSINADSPTALRLLDRQRANAEIAFGSIDWQLFTEKGPLVDSATAGPARLTRSEKQLTFAWTNAKADVTVDISLDNVAGLQMRIAVTNHTAEPIVSIKFPSQLTIDQRNYKELLAGDHIGVALDMQQWFEKGGNLGYGIPYPTGHADLLVATGRDKRPTTAFACIHTEDILMPSHAGYGKTGDHRGSFWHSFDVWIAKDKNLTSPNLVLFQAKNAFDAFAIYRKLLGLDTAPSVKQKLGSKFDTAAKSVVLKYECAWYGGGAIRDFAKMTQNLPSPLIYEPVEFWPVRFDDHYPDYFPINAALGTDDDFRRMIDTAHARGSLVMPFFSPAHWSLGSPSEKLVGDQVAVKDAAGKPDIYDGRPNYGVNYFVTGWNKLVPDKAAENLRQFRSFGCDSAFADIVGNVHRPLDFNPATPNPRAHFAGMIRLGEVMAKELPMTTEGSSDLHSRNFWGMFQFFLKHKYRHTGHNSWTAADGLMADWTAKNSSRAVRLFPFNTALASGLSVIYPHNLGPPIFEQPMLNDSLAMGMGLYMSYEQVTRGRADWLDYLHELQLSVVQHYFGEPMTNFEYIAGFDDVSVTEWGNLKLYVNHIEKPATVTIDGKPATLTPYGMLRVLDGKRQAIPTFAEWKAQRPQPATQAAR
jgi:hypothetical protein